MGTADGRVIGTTQIVDHGLASQRWNLVILGDGYQEAELPQFAGDAQRFVDTLFATAPYGPLQRAINVYRVDVASTDSGADDPIACEGSGATARTYFDASFCNNGVQRLLEVNDVTVVDVANAQLPAWHMLIVIVNSQVYGGSGGQVACFSLASDANEIALHEMGHTAFAFADEYEYYQGCGVDVGHDHYAGAEPSQPNVTADANRDTIKWRDLIAPTTAMPTTANADCSKCDPRPNPVAASTVGAFEGAAYFHCGAYRAQFNCRMRALDNPFCAVCQRTIQQTLRPFIANGPAVVGVGNNVYFFAKQPAGRVFYNHAPFKQAGVGWREVEGDGLTDVAPAAGAIGSYVYVAIKGLDGNISVNQADLNKPFGQWFPAGFQTDVAPAVVGVGNNVYFFAKHLDGRVFYNHAPFKQAGVGWKEVDGHGLTDVAPAAGAIGDHVYVAIKGLDGVVYVNQADANKPFGQWFPAGFQTDVAPAVVGVGKNVYFFAKHLDGRVFYDHAPFKQAGVGWKEVEGDGRADAAPGAGAIGDHVFVAIKGLDGALYVNQADVNKPFGFWFPG